jgi:hypothetical protein
MTPQVPHDQGTYWSDVNDLSRARRPLGIVILSIA